MNTAVNNATEYRNLPLAVLTESKTNPRRTFEDDSLKELADFVSGHKKSAFCSADSFVAERHEWRLAASGPRSERHITDQRNANATEVFASVKARNSAMGRSRDRAASSTPKACGNIAQLITEE